MSGTRSGGDDRSRIGLGLDGVREVVDQLRNPSRQVLPDRANRSDVRDEVLLVLAEQPADGYRIVRVLQERGDGAGAGAGAVYPTLQLLADEDLAVAADTDGRRTWSLTAAGRAAAEAAASRTADRGRPADHATARRGGVARSAAQLVQTASLAAQTATPEQLAEVVDALDTARRRILAILVRD